MQVIIISSNSKTHKHWHLTRPKLMMLVALLVSLVSVSSYSFANWLNSSHSPSSPIPNQSASLNSNSKFTPPANEQTVDQEKSATEFYARQLGGLQAETIRLRMFSERLAEMAGVDTTAF